MDVLICIQSYLAGWRISRPYPREQTETVRMRPPRCHHSWLSPPVRLHPTPLPYTPWATTRKGISIKLINDDRTTRYVLWVYSTAIHLYEEELRLVRHAGAVKVAENTCKSNRLSVRAEDKAFLPVRWQHGQETISNGRLARCGVVERERILVMKYLVTLHTLIHVTRR